MTKVSDKQRNTTATGKPSFASRKALQRLATKLGVDLAAKGKQDERSEESGSCC